MFDFFEVDDLETGIPAKAAKAKPANSNMTSTLTGGTVCTLHLSAKNMNQVGEQTSHTCQNILQALINTLPFCAPNYWFWNPSGFL